MLIEENRNYPVMELICLVDILVKCGEISRETLTSKAAGIALAMENSLPSLDIASELRKQVAEAEQRKVSKLLSNSRTLMRIASQQCSGQELLGAVTSSHGPWIEM